MITKCKHCRAEFEVADDRLYRRVTCPRCGEASEALPVVSPAATQPSAKPPAPPTGGAQTGGPVLPPIAPSVSAPSGSATVPVGRFISPRPRAGLALFFLIAMVALSVAWLWDRYLDLQMYRRVQANEEVTEQQLEASDARGPWIAVPFIAASLGSVIAFLVWEYRAYKNLRVLGAQRLRFSPGGSVGWYFCPIANLWKPCQAMVDIWRGSGGAGTGFVVLWWLCWLAGAVVRPVNFPLKMRLLLDPEPALEQIVTATYVDMASDASGIISGCLTIGLIWAVSSRQLLLHGQQDPPGAADGFTSPPFPQ